MIFYFYWIESEQDIVVSRFFIFDRLALYLGKHDLIDNLHIRAYVQLYLNSFIKDKIIHPFINCADYKRPYGDNASKDIKKYYRHYALEYGMICDHKLREYSKKWSRINEGKTF